MRTNLFYLRKSNYGIAIAYPSFMFRWLALAYIVAVLVVSAKAKAKNDFRETTHLVFDHQTNK